MDSAPNLKQELSMMLDTALKERLLQGENTVISLPGSFGEALVITDKRAIVIRECEGVGGRCDVHTYALGSVVGAETASSGMGGHIEIKLTEPPTSQDAARVYFPSYDQAKFQAAAQYIGQVSTRSAAPKAEPLAAAAAVGGPDGCSNCGGVVGPDAVYCGHCGMQVRARCATCGGASPIGSEFCESCGRKFEELATQCEKCGARVQRWQNYCADCGSILHQACASCGAIVVESWKYCASCGRQLGSGHIDARSSFGRRLQERARQSDESAQHGAGTTVMGSAPIVDQPAPSAPPQPSGSADLHNQRGRQLFDDGEVEQAIREFQSAVELDPQNASYHCNLAIAYDENDQDEQALSEYERTLQLDPDDLTALLSLGYMHNENDELEKAQECWGRILEIAPNSAEAQEVRENLRHQEDL